MVYTDQFFSDLTVRLPYMYEHDKDSQRYVGGTILLDESYIYFSVHCHVSLGSTNTVRYKHSFGRG